MSDLIEVAKIGRKIGLKGFCKLHISSDFPQFFTKGRKLIAVLADSQKELEIDGFNEARSEIKFVGINTPEEISALTHAMLYTTIDETTKADMLEDGEFYWFDLIGLDAYENDTLLGTISAIDESVELYLTIRLDESIKCKQRDLILPWGDRFVVSVDMDKKRVLLANALDIIDAL